MKISLAHRFAATYGQVVLASVPFNRCLNFTKSARMFSGEQALEAVKECLQEIPLHDDVTGSHEIEVPRNAGYDTPTVAVETEIRILDFISIVPMIKDVKEQYVSTIQIGSHSGNTVYTLYVSVMTDGKKSIRFVHSKTGFTAWQSP
jgi:hypothetical protein